MLQGGRFSPQAPRPASPSTAEAPQDGEGLGSGMLRGVSATGWCSCCAAVTHQLPLCPVPLLLDLLPPFFMFEASHCQWLKQERETAPGSVS